MQSFTAVIERDEATGLFVGYVPGWPGAHSQGATLDELRQNLEEVVAMLLEDGAPKLEGEFRGDANGEGRLDERGWGSAQRGITETAASQPRSPSM
jgi:predicted RNase H-like HicB family nuclease